MHLTLEQRIVIKLHRDYETEYIAVTCALELIITARPAIRRCPEYLGCTRAGRKAWSSQKKLRNRREEINRD